MNIQKKILLLLAVLLSLAIQACSTFSSIPATNQNQIDSLLNSDFFKSSQAAISVYDLTDDKPLYQRNEKLLLRPASNQKILTTAAAYLFLGSGYKFKTSVYHSGEIKDSVCSGDLFVVGGLDPDFTTNDLDSLIGEIKHSGIKTIKGNIFADVSTMDSLFWGEGWMWDDDPGYYAAYLTPLSINKNCINVVYEPGEVGKPSLIELIPNTNYFGIVNTSETIDTGKSDLIITRDWINRSNNISVKGKIAKSSKRDTVSLNVFNPTFYFLNLMKERLLGSGISFTGKVDTMTLTKDEKKIFSLERDLDRVIINTNKTSDNLSAELLLHALALKYSGDKASAKKGIVLIDSLISLVGLNPKNYMIADGSGLSFYNLLSAELLTEILKYFYYKQPDLFQKLSNSFPVSGFDGTLSNRMKDSSTFKRVFAKTGSLRGVSNLSGYILSKNNHTIAFSVLIQNYTGGSNQARTIQDNICKIIFETN
jgi:D-alanyl-D-alanine carboxypeptidase/D-alanyl-D-alanine-endopeptidase (penicillin-binding protein 4)